MNICECIILSCLILIVFLSIKDEESNLAKLQPENLTPKEVPPSAFPTTTCAPSAFPTTTFAPSSSPTRIADRALTCVQTVQGNELSIPHSESYRQGEVHCLKLDDGQEAYFGFTWTNQFGLFFNKNETVWEITCDLISTLDRWTFQDDGNLVLDDAQSNPIWTSESENNFDSELKMSSQRIWIETGMGYSPWSGPSAPFDNDYPDPNGALQYYAYYYPWYLRDDWSRHDYQDEPLLGKYGTDEVAVAEQHIEWALQTGITNLVVSWWGNSSLSMRHFSAGMMNAPSLRKIKFCILYETPILDDRGNWYDGTLEDALYEDLKVIRDEFFDHPSYLRIDNRPVVIFYITRSRMDFQFGFDGPSVLANMRRKLGQDIYFIADEPFFNSFNDRPDVNGNAFVNGTQVFDAYTTYNMYSNSRVNEGETATDYQLREALPIWQRWAEQLPFFPNVMPQYHDFRGKKPLLGNPDDFMKQLREVACLPQTNFGGAPHIMFITSFNEWWEGTQIEPEDGSPDNWNNYGYDFMTTLAEFKKKVDSSGINWCDAKIKQTDLFVPP